MKQRIIVNFSHDPADLERLIFNNKSIYGISRRNFVRRFKNIVSFVGSNKFDISEWEHSDKRVNLLVKYLKRCVGIKYAIRINSEEFAATDRIIYHFHLTFDHKNSFGDMYFDVTEIKSKIYPSQIIYNISHLKFTKLLKFDTLELK